MRLARARRVVEVVDDIPSERFSNIAANQCPDWSRLHISLFCYPGPQPIVLQSHNLSGNLGLVVTLASSVLVGRRNPHRLEDSGLRPLIMVFGQPTLSPSYQIRQSNLFV